MASISTRPPQRAPQEDWFAQNAPPPTYQPGPNQTQPVGPGVPVGDDLRARDATPTGPLSPAEVLAFLSQYGTDYESVRAADAAGRQKYGAAWPQLLDHATKLDKWQFANGQVYDLVNSSGSPAASWVTNAVPETHGGGMGGGTLGSMGGGGGIPGLNPQIDFMLEKAQQGLERGAAARGTLMTGGFQKALGEHLAKFAQAEGWQPAFNNNLSLANLGLNATGMANQAGSSYGNQIGTNANNVGDLLTNQSNVNAQGTIDQANNDRGVLGDLAGAANQIGNSYLWWQMNRPQPQPNSYWPNDLYQGPTP